MVLYAKSHTWHEDRLLELSNVVKGNGTIDINGNALLPRAPVNAPRDPGGFWGIVNDETAPGTLFYIMYLDRRIFKDVSLQVSCIRS